MSGRTSAVFAGLRRASGCSVTFDEPICHVTNPCAGRETDIDDGQIKDEEPANSKESTSTDEFSLRLNRCVHLRATRRTRARPDAPTAFPHALAPPFLPQAFSLVDRLER